MRRLAWAIVATAFVVYLGGGAILLSRCDEWQPVPGAQIHTKETP